MNLVVDRITENHKQQYLDVYQVSMYVYRPLGIRRWQGEKNNSKNTIRADLDNLDILFLVRTQQRKITKL